MPETEIVKEVGDEVSLEPYMIEDPEFVGFVDGDDQRNLYKWASSFMKSRIDNVAHPNVLQVGCGRGDFYEYVPEFNYIGLESNYFKVKAGLERNGLIEGETILNTYFSDYHRNNYVEVDEDDGDPMEFDAIYFINEDIGQYLDEEIDDYSNFNVDIITEIFVYKIITMLKDGGHASFFIPNMSTYDKVRAFDYFSMSFSMFNKNSIEVVDTYTPSDESHQKFTNFTVYNR